MANIELYSYQIDAIKKMHNGCILCGDVGSGKSRTALCYWYFVVAKGSIQVNGEGKTFKPKEPIDLYIITTAKKRDSSEWEEELVPFYIPGIKVTVDSWNNIQKYKNVYNAFFIFDEQRVVGKGAWAKTFIKIANKNKWVLLSATPGDTWSDYIPVFVANHFFKNRTEFNMKHVVFNNYTSFPQIDHYINQGALIRFRKMVLVKMDYKQKTIKKTYRNYVSYDPKLYNVVWKQHWVPYENEPIAEPGKLCAVLRRVVNSDQSRVNELQDLLLKVKRPIIFYNYNFELEIIKDACENVGLYFQEWNGQVHQPLPEGDEWAYIVQYNAASEGWNCITSNQIIFYSLNYSYKMMKQAAGRIDRSNTPFKELEYHYILSKAPIDTQILKALNEKRNFNVKAFLGVS